MILGSHNSWSFLPPKKWWQRLIAFTARCQRLTIREQYDFGVRCFDLRIRFIDGMAHIVHNDFDYGLFSGYRHDLKFLHDCGDVSVRVVHDVRTKKRYTQEDVKAFKGFCDALERTYPRIKFWFGRNLYDWNVDYEFEYMPYCTEKYSSVCSPRLIDDWWPWLYAQRHNARIRQGTYRKDEILLIDYVDIL